MGLIRSGNTQLTAEDDKELVDYLWPIVREMVKTAIENRQNLVIEGSYIPFDWKKDFTQDYLKEIQYVCLIMSEQYIKTHFSDVKKYARMIENRGDDSWCTLASVLKDNTENLRMCKQYECNYILIENNYDVDIRSLFC